MVPAIYCLAQNCLAQIMSPQPRESLQVFLCHGSEDKATVRGLYQRLRDDGFSPWLDEEDLIPGQDWELEIKKAVRAADVVVVCLSASSASRKGFAQKEIRIALDEADKQPEGDLYIIPLRLEELELPDRLQRWHWVNFFDKDGYEKLIKALGLKSRRPVVASASPAEGGSRADSGSVADRSVHRKSLIGHRGLIQAGGAVLVILVSIWFIWGLGISPVGDQPITAIR